MARSRSTLFAALALIASATMPKAKGPARSKKPGCSIRISAGAAIWCMTPSHKRKLLPLEVRRSAEAEDLGLVESRLEQRLGDVGTEGAKRGIPNDAEAGRHTNLRAILDEASLAASLPKIASGASARHRRQGDRGRRETARFPQRTGIDEHGTLYTEIVWYERERETHLRRRRPKQFPPEGIPSAVWDSIARHRIFARVARTIASAREAPHRFAALEEQVGQANILAAPPLDCPS